MSLPPVEHDRAAFRFVMRLGDAEAELVYRLAGSRMFLDHVGVPYARRNLGVAAEITRTALEHARTNRLDVIPVCPYVIWYLARHPEYEDLVKR